MHDAYDKVNCLPKAANKTRAAKRRVMMETNLAMTFFTSFLTLCFIKTDLGHITSENKKERY